MLLAYQLKIMLPKEFHLHFVLDTLS